MPLDEEVCYFCRRPRDEFEIEKARDEIRERAEKRRRRPFVIARAALAAAALLFASRHRDFFFARVSSLGDEFHREMQDVEDPQRRAARAPQTAAGAAALLGGPPEQPAPRPAPPPAPRPAPQPAPRPAPSSAVQSNVPAESPVKRPRPPAKPRPPRFVVLPQEPDRPQAGLLRVYGVVYDLKTLRPVPHAVVRINVPPPSDTTETDEDGRYRLDFSPQAATDSDVLVTVTAAGYREGQIEDPDPPYLMWPLRNRLDIILGLTATDMAAVTLSRRAGDTIVPLDLVLVPGATAPAK
jgi:hypothetical protein